jgi:hypothetical protein
MAQQFTAGIEELKNLKSVKRTADDEGRLSTLFNRPLHGLRHGLLQSQR